ncbi:MAG: hypothetical protein EBS01_15080 [Verrucomicrobia bacterium]|nr:hypothetical protein [Verrucomicrobiota bacterium]
MDSYLANRPKIDPVNAYDSGVSMDGLAYGDPIGGDHFMAGLPKTGGFQSLKSALVEAGSVVDPAHMHTRQLRSKDGGKDVQPAEPSVEVITHEGRIEKVIVTCSCCRTIELECSY